VSVAAGCAAGVLGCGVGGAVLTVAVPRRLQPLVGGLTTALVGLVGVVLGVATLADGLPERRVGWLVPLAGVLVGGDATAAFLALVTGAVAVSAGVFTVGYAQRSHVPAVALGCLPVFVAAMLLVPYARSVTGFLLAWELMALTSAVLVLAEHHHEAARAAGQLYAVMTQLGFASVLLGLVVFAGAAGGESFTALAAADLSPATRSAIFLLTLVGFGSKAGLLPLHAWLPRAHPEAPSPVSALMSAAMVNLGIYGIVRFDVVLLRPGPRWWGLLLLVVGAVTAVYSVLQATVATDLKRLLAYSTGENMGLVTVALGTGLLLQSAHNPGTARIAFAAAALHLAGHAAFKSLGFLCAGSVQVATGLRDLDQLGGLVGTMPFTTRMFGLAALGASGLPLGAGFVSEWLLLQSLIHGRPTGGGLLALVIPFAVGAVALTTGLGVAAMVKAFGVGFLARPRAEAAAAAVEVPLVMRLSLALPAAACVVLAVAPGVLAPTLRRVVAEVSGSAGAGPSLGVLLRLPGIPGSIAPLLVAAAFAVAVAVSVALAGAGARRRAAPAAVPLWACGAGPLTPRMEYTATSYAEPLQRVFADVLRPEEDVQVSHYAESRYLVEQISYRSQVVDAIENRLHPRVAAVVDAVAAVVRRGHQGSVHASLAYGGLGLLLVLVLAR
jgi:hypothetical protein